MIVYKRWMQQTKNGSREWEREGWFLFGFIPLLLRDINLRGRFGKSKAF